MTNRVKTGTSEKVNNRSYILIVPERIGQEFIYNYSEEDKVVIPWATEEVLEWGTDYVKNNLKIEGEVSREEIDKAIFNFFKPESINFRKKRENLATMEVAKGTVSWNPLIVMEIKDIGSKVELSLSNSRKIELSKEEYTTIRDLDPQEISSVPLQLEGLFLYLDFSCSKRECVI